MFDDDSSFIRLAQSAGKPDDSTCIAKFFLKPRLLGLKSREAGRKIYEDREYVEIKVKGQDKQVVVKEVTEADIMRFPQAYLAFKNLAVVPATGTLLSDMEGVSPSMIERLAGLGVRTAEDVAGLTDEGLIRVGLGARELQNRCRAFLSKSTPEVQELKAQLEAEKQRNDELLARLEKLEAATPAKRTRKKAAQ